MSADLDPQAGPRALGDVLDALGIGLAWLDSQFRFRAANQSYLEHIRLTWADCHERSILQAVPGLRPLLEPALAETLSTGQQLSRDVTVSTSDGTMTRWDYVFQPDPPDGVLLVARPTVVNPEPAPPPPEVRPLDSIGPLAIILEFLPLGLALTNPDGQIRLASRRLAELLPQGDQRRRLVGRLIFDLLPRGSRASFQNSWGVATISAEPFRLSRVEYASDGRPPRYWNFIVVPIEVRAGAGVSHMLVQAHDVTEQGRIEQDLRATLRRAEEASQAKTRLLATLSHDLRNPLNAVVLLAKSLKGRLQGRLDPSERDDLRAIQTSALSAAELIRDLLDTGQVQGGKARIHETEFPLRDLLNELAIQFQPLAHAKGIDFRFDPDAVLAVQLKTDRAKVSQILSNLISNAIRYTEQGYVALWAVEEPLEQGKRVLIGVEDTGCGIAKAELPHIFDEYYQVTRPGRAASEGRGLGLAISRRIASLLGLGLAVRSRLGEGSTFRLVVPGKHVVGGGLDSGVTLSPSEAEREAEAQPSPPRAEPARLVVAEDDPLSQRAVVQILAAEGHACRAVSAGREVLDLVKQWRPDLILMDVGLPDLDGLTITERLHADPATSGVPVILLTGHIAPEYMARARDLGVAGWLEKPIDPEDLVARVANALASAPRPADH